MNHLKQLLALLLALVMIGCTAPVSSPSGESLSEVQESLPTATPEPTPKPTPEPTPTPTPTPAPKRPDIVQPDVSKIQNAAEAGKLPEGAIMNGDAGQRTAWNIPTAFILFPESWPLELTGDYLPKYPGSGWMEMGIIKSPDLLDPTKALLVGVMIRDYQPQELTDYRERLLSSGYKQNMEDLPEDLRSFVGASSLYHRLDFGEEVTALIVMHDGDVGERFSLFLRFNKRIEASEKERVAQADKNLAQTGTRLLSAKQAGCLPKGAEPDKVTKRDLEFDQANGVTTLHRAYPTKWPTGMMDGFIPVYPGDGWMYLQMTTSPDHSDDLLAEVNTMVIYDYSVQQLMDYMLALGELGFAGGNPQKDIPGAPEGTIMMRFTREDCIVTMISGEDSIGSYVDLSTAMISRKQKRQPSAEIRTREEFIDTTKP